MAQPIAVNGYSADAVRDALFSPGVEYRFKLHLLDNQGYFIRELFFDSATFKNDATAEIQRAFDFTIEASEAGTLNLISQLLEPYVGIVMPTAGTDGTSLAWYSQGIFYPSADPFEVTESGEQLYKAVAYDKLWLLKDTEIEDSYDIAAGTNISIAIESLLNFVPVRPFNIEYVSLAVSESKSFEPGTEPFVIFKALLDEGNLVAFVDHQDMIHVVRWDNPLLRPIDDELLEGQYSILDTPASRANDFFQKPNRVVMYSTTIGQGAGKSAGEQRLKAFAEDMDITSRTSQPRKGRIKRKVFKDVAAADQATLQLRANRELLKQPDDRLEISSAIIPWAGPRDIVRLIRADVNANGPYERLKFDYAFEAGAAMKQTLVKSGSGAIVNDRAVGAAVYAKHLNANSRSAIYGYIDPAYSAGDARVVLLSNFTGTLATSPLSGPFKRMDSYTPVAGDFVRLSPGPQLGTWIIDGKVV